MTFDTARAAHLATLAAMGWRVVSHLTVILAEFLGIDCTFTALDREPWD